MTLQTFEFTAISESSLVSAGGIGSSLGCGDTFTVPTYADTCIVVTDNDSKLSGDSYCNEHADDHSNQTASLTIDGQEVGNGGQIYAEQYWWAYDANHNWFVIVEIEQENSDDDYFAFYTGNGYQAPAPGTELTIDSSCNVTSDWINFNDLDGGDKAPAPVDPTCDVITLEAEDFHLSKFVTEHSSTASEGEIAKLYNGDGELSKDFTGESGTYQISLFAQDESDGQSMIKVFVGDSTVPVAVITLDQDNNGGGSNNGSFSEIDLGEVAIENGDEIRIEAWKDGGEFVRLDKVVLTKVDCDLPTAPICEDFENGSFPIESNLVVSDDHWVIQDGEATAHGKADGSLTFTPIDVSGQTLVSFDIRTDDIHPFETADEFIVEVKLDNGSYEVLDVFKRDGDVFVGSITGQTYGETDATLGYIVGDAGTSTVQLRLTADFSWQDETVIVDDVCFEPACGDVKETFDGLSAGDVASDFSGFTVVAQREHNPSTNDAMIFDTDNPTGGDNDLAYSGKGNVIIISEDNDSTDPDDNAAGGTITFTFDAPSTVTSLEVLDIEESTGTIELFDANGDLIKSVAIPATGNNGEATVFINADDVAEMVVNLPGSGAVNDLCFDPGVVELAGLGDFVFLDADADGIQDAGEAGVAGVIVDLKDANGVVIDTTTTDANGFYSFTDLTPGTYSVQFTPPTGFEFTLANQGTDDGLDSDANFITGMTQTVTLAAGDFNGTLDAGLVQSNSQADVNNASGMLCADSLADDELVFDLDALASDPDGDTLTFSVIDYGADGVAGGGDDVTTAIAEGETVILTSGAEVSIEAGDLVYNLEGTGAFSDVLLGDKGNDSFGIAAFDGLATSTGQIDIEVCGALNLIETLDNTAPVSVTYEIIEVGVGAGSLQLARTEVDLSLNDLGIDATAFFGENVDFGLNGEFLYGYCVDKDRGRENGPGQADIYLSTGDIPDLGTDGEAIVDKEENLDLVNWVLNQGFEDTFSFNDIQSAIWELVDNAGGTDTNIFAPGVQLSAGAQQIVDLAFANGEGFSPNAADEDILGVIIVPTDDLSGDGENGQPYIVGFQLTACDCDPMVLI
ncbi:MAG: SdrD B-like domain-containing protein [Pseudomonadota bacterium]